MRRPSPDVPWLLDDEPFPPLTQAWDANTPAPGGLPLTYAWQLPDAADAQTPSSAPQAETLPKPAAPQTWSVFATNESADLSTEQTAPNPSAALSGPIAELPTASSISEDGKIGRAHV